MTDVALRVAAGVACVGVIAAPAVVAGYRKARAFLAARSGQASGEKATVSLSDMRIVLDLAARLKAAGMVEGVALCQQLLDVMLGNTKAKK